LLLTPDGHKGNVFSVAYNPDGRYMATASSDETVKLWNSQDGKLLRELKEHQAEVCAVAFSPDGKLLVSGGKDRMIRCWKVDEVLGQEQKQ